jgi:hypothetical protein
VRGGAKSLAGQFGSATLWTVVTTLALNSSSAREDELRCSHGKDPRDTREYGRTLARRRATDAAASRALATDDQRDDPAVSAPHLV